MIVLCNNYLRIQLHQLKHNQHKELDDQGTLILMQHLIHK